MSTCIIIQVVAEGINISVKNDFFIKTPSCSFKSVFGFPVAQLLELVGK